MMANKVAGVVMGAILIIAAPVLHLTLGLGISWGVIMAVIGFFAMQDGLEKDEVQKDDRDQINRGR